jgi:hypothetical protein
VHAAFHPSPSLPPPFPPSTTHHLILYTPSWWLSKNNQNKIKINIIINREIMGVVNETLKSLNTAMRS